MRLKVGDKIYLKPGYGFNRELEGKFGYVVSVGGYNISHTVLNDDGSYVMVNRFSNTWLTCLHDAPGLELVGHMEIKTEILKHSMV